MNNVYVCLPCDRTEDVDGWTYLFVTAVPTTIDYGEIVAACQVLYPTLVGINIEPVKENEDASD